MLDQNNNEDFDLHEENDRLVRANSGDDIEPVLPSPPSPYQ